MNSSLLEIKRENISILKDFVSVMGTSSQTFRYFKNRSLDCIENHLITYVETENERPICYGHLDKEGDNIWLGVCVVEQAVGRGLGKKMMQNLTFFAKENNISEIKLSVDIANTVAVEMYKKFNFKEEKRDKNILFMSLKLGDKNG